MAKQELLRPEESHESLKGTGKKKKRLTPKQRIAVYTTAGTLAIMSAAGAAEGCVFNKENSRPTTLTVPPVTETVPNPTTTIPVTTTEKPTTTVTETSTSTTERAFASWESLINTQISINDVRNMKIEVANRDYRGFNNVPEKLQIDFKNFNPNYEIIYIGPDNKGNPNDLSKNELNDVLILKKDGNFYITNLEDYGAFAMDRDELFAQKWYLIGAKLAEKPIILIPGSKDFYVYDEHLNFVVRIVRDKNSKYKQTLLNWWDVRSNNLENNLNIRNNINRDNLFKKHLALNKNNTELAIFFEGKNTMGFIPQNNIKTSIRDENGAVVVDLAFVIGSNRPQIEEMFK